MTESYLFRVQERLRPSEGWLPFFLLAAAVGLLVTAVREVGWVAEDSVMFPTAVAGLLLGVLLAKRPLHAFWAWLLITVYCSLITVFTLAHLTLPLTTLSLGWEATRQYWLQQGAVFIDRAGGWLTAVSSDGRSQETIVFAALLGVATFLLAAFAGWATFRWQRPLPALLLMGLVFALNGYFGVAPVWETVLFVGTAALLTAIVNYAHLEREWTAAQVDYPEDARLEMMGYAAMIAAFLLIFSLALPAFSITRIQAWFASLRPVAEAESTLGQAFAGVQAPRQLSNPGGVGGSGLMPRQYLLGIAPELRETVVMTAVVSVALEDEQFLAPPELLQGTHWRALSYDVYTGQGWAISEERLDPTAAFQNIPIPDSEGQTTLSQAVYWLQDGRTIRYTTGLPSQFDHATLVSWRGLNDLARVRAEGEKNIYQATSHLITATPDELRQIGVADTPAALLVRYTALPDSLADRVRELAQEVAGNYDNPYDQARALEQFLRQYPYSLAVPLPPKNSDPVDYFLFDLQTGYCDYFASSMVVLARALGLPARLAVGYLAQPPDENGIQTIRQIHGHSWAELYFAGYGWVEFEPTAAFPSPRDTTITQTFDRFDFVPTTEEPFVPPPIPEANPARPFPWPRLLIIALFFVGLFLIWCRQRREQVLRADGVVWAYGRLQHSATKLGQPPTASQTPHEFSQALLSNLDGRSPGQRLVHPITRIIHLYNARRYAGQATGGQEEAKRAWGELRRPLWWLRLKRW
jgi:transglutaminase-like putative cysteine protease